MGRYKRGRHGFFAGSYGGGGGGGGSSRRRGGGSVVRRNPSGRRPSRIHGQLGRTKRAVIIRPTGHGQHTAVAKVYVQKVRVARSQAPPGASRQNRTITVISPRG